MWTLPVLAAAIVLAGCSKPNDYEEAAIRDLNRLHAAHINGSSQADLRRLMNEAKASFRRAAPKARSTEREDELRNAYNHFHFMTAVGPKPGRPYYTPADEEFPLLVEMYPELLARTTNSAGVVTTNAITKEASSMAAALRIGDTMKRINSW